MRHTGGVLRPLQLIVLFELLAVLVLGVLWLSSVQAAPAQAIGAGAPAPADSRAQAASAQPSGERADPGPTTPPLGRVEVTSAAARDGALGVVVRGRLSTPGEPPQPDETSVSFRRVGMWRGGTVVAGGQYAVAGLAPGTWQVQVRAEGFARYEAEHTLGTAPVQVVDLPLEPAHVVQVYVRTPDGRRLADAVAETGVQRPGLTVIVTEQPLASDLPATDNVSVGDVGLARYRSTQQRGKPDPDAPDGELQLDRPPPLHAALLLRHVVLARQPIGPGQRQLTFEVDPADFAARLGTVRMRLVDGATGQPLTSRVGISLQSAQGGGARAKPDAEGRVVATAIPPGLVSLQIQGNGKDLESRWDLVRVPAGGVVELGDVLLYAPVKVAGRLIDQAGEPVAGSVLWTDLATMTWPRELIGRRIATADGDGNFTLWGTGPRRYVVLARSRDGLVGFATVDARAGTPPPVEIHMARAVPIAVEIAGDDPFVGYMLTVRDGVGVPVATRRIEARWREASLSVPPGDYTLEVHGDADQLLKTVPLKARSDRLSVVVP